MTDKFHLGWFLNFVADEWNGNWGDGGRDFTGDFYVDMARDLERAKFDYVLIEDKLMVSTAFGGTMEHDLKHGVNPKHDPVPLAVLMANATTRLGVVPTMSTSFYPPFLLARLCSTIDHIARGRFGWNVVTSGEDRAAQNFGLDKLYEHDERYAMASEYMELVSKLWESWEPDAIERDYETGTYANFKKVHTDRLRGQVLQVPRSAEHRAVDRSTGPTIAQAGASPPGRELAAQHADTIVAPANGVEAMKAYRDDIHARMTANGRDPAHCKVLYLVSPIVADTHEEALAKRERWFNDSALHRVHAGRDLLDHRDRLRPVRSRRAGAGRDDQRRARFAGELPVPRQGQDAARNRHRQRPVRQRPVRRHTRRGRRGDGRR